MVAEELKKALKDPATAAATLGPASLVLSLPLWLMIPLILIAVGLGLYIVVSFLPFIVAGVIFGMTYWLLKRAGTPEPWVWALPVLFGLLAIAPAFVPAFRAFVLAQVNAQAAAMGILERIVDWIVGPFLFLTALIVLGFLFLFLSSVKQLGRPGAFLAATLGLAIGVGIALNAIGLGLIDPRAYVISELTIAGRQMVLGALPIILGGAIAGSIQYTLMRLERR